MNALTCEYNGKQRIYVVLCEDERNADRGTVRGFQLHPEEGIRSYRVGKMMNVRDCPEIVVDRADIEERMAALEADKNRREEEAYEAFMKAEAEKMNREDAAYPLGR
jgi:hypothetical protein